MSELEASKQITLALNGSLNFHGNEYDLNSPDVVEIGGHSLIWDDPIGTNKYNMNGIIFVSRI